MDGKPRGVSEGLVEASFLKLCVGRDGIRRSKVLPPTSFQIMREGHFPQKLGCSLLVAQPTGA